MDFRIFTEPQQGATYETLLSVARAAEDAGFDAFFRSDHWLAMGDSNGLPGPTDAWITLAGLARDTSRIRLGTLVNSATFRLPGPLAIGVAQVDDMSGGRVELGLGAGWFLQEHQAYGIHFPDLGERFDILEEQLSIITGLWRTADGDRFSYSGNHYEVTESPALPKPVQAGGPPVIVGGGGPRRTPRLAATYATEFNLPFRSIGDFRDQCSRVRAACEAQGREPDSLVYSAALVVCVGDNDAEIERRASAIGREADELRQNGLCGRPDEVLQRLGDWKDAGAERIYLQVLDLDDIEHVALLGESFIGKV